MVAIPLEPWVLRSGCTRLCAWCLLEVPIVSVFSFREEQGKVKTDGERVGILAIFSLLLRCANMAPFRNENIRRR